MTMLIKGKKGFTLIELLAVIIILVIIMAIVTPIILKNINDIKKRAFKNSVYGIIKAAEYNYSLQIIKANNMEKVVYQYIDGVERSTPYNNKLEYKGISPQSGAVIINKKGAIALALHDGKYCIEKDFTSDDLIITEKNFEDCDLEFLIYYTDASGANSPRLLKGMTAIVWDESTSDWVEASNINDPDEQNWFDYGDRKWANVRTTDGSFWVWIPRYAYKITNGFHSNIAGTIDIKFLNGTSNTPQGDIEIKTDDYGEEIDGIIQNTENFHFLHPAFKFGDDDIPGFWVAKFEPSGTLDKIKILPGQVSLNNSKIKEFYNKASIMSSYICDGQCEAGTDTHMMKNMEWGAVAYLSQSQYGIGTELDKNEELNKTGGGDGVAYSNNENQKQSTTGTIYGIYDMNGGKYEYVAAYVDNGNSSLNNGSNIVGAISKYKDVYTKASTDNAQNNYEAAENKYGDAIWETSSSGENSTSWYTAGSNFIYGGFSWLIRGSYAGDTYTGVFCFHFNTGLGGKCGSFRPVVLYNKKK